MLDIGFFELLVIGVVLIIVMGPERLPEVAKQIAFFIRKGRESMFRLKSEMQGEIQGTPFADIEKAKQELANLKNDLRQFGRDLADSAEQPSTEKSAEKKPSEQTQALTDQQEMTGAPIEDSEQAAPTEKQG